MRKTSILFRQFIVAFTVCLASTATGNAQTISTYAGTGVQGYTGDGGACSAATFDEIFQIAMDGAGNMYIADPNNAVVRKVNTSGIVTTFAGNGSLGFSGDGGQATAAKLSYPAGIAVDPSGIVYIADFGNNRIRRVSASGNITTYAGNGSNDTTGDGGSATAATISRPWSLATDAVGNLFISDGYGVVRKVTTSGIINRYAGRYSGATSASDGIPATDFRFIHGYLNIALDAGNNLYIAEKFQSRLRKVTPAGIITTVAGTTPGFSGDGGPATAAQLKDVAAVTVDISGNIFVYDNENYRVRKINSYGTITTIAGNGSAGNGGDGGPATAARVDSIGSMVVNTAGTLYMACGFAYRVRKITSVGTGFEQTSFAAKTFSVTPNPSRGNLTLNFDSANDEPVQVTVTNTLGMKVKECTMNGGNSHNIALQVPPGLYYISVQSSAAREVQPVVIE